MERQILKFSRVRDVRPPSRVHDSAGVDFYIPNDWNNGQQYLIHPQEAVLIPSGIHANIPKGWALVAFNKSGVSTKKHLDVLACICDAGYEGEIHLSIVNAGRSIQFLNPGDKIIQFVMLPVGMHEAVEVEFKDLYAGEKSSRGADGFGSTDHK